MTPYWEPLLTDRGPADDLPPDATTRFPPQGRNGPISYYKRFRMEADLDAISPPVLPEGCYWVSWCPALLEAHAAVLHGCFRDEIDAAVFPSLGDPGGCHALMTEIARKNGFLAGATWLLACPEGFCGTIQGVGERGVGSIQNVGILPQHRGRGLGACLVLQALTGFRAAGLPRATLEVTAQNERAIRVYRRLGFRRSKTIYKAVATSSW